MKMKKFKKGEKVFIEAEYRHCAQHNMFPHKITVLDIGDARSISATARDKEIFSLEEMKEKLGAQLNTESHDSIPVEIVSKSIAPTGKCLVDIEFISKWIPYDDVAGINVGDIFRLTIPKQKTKLQQVNEIVEMTQEQLDRVMGVIS